jgi:hypothetical protein
MWPARSHFETLQSCAPDSDWLWSKTMKMRKVRLGSFLLAAIVSMDIAAAGERQTSRCAAWSQTGDRVVTVDSGTGISHNACPFDSPCRTQYLYKAGEIGPAGSITAVRFLLGLSYNETFCLNVTIKLGHTRKKELGYVLEENMEVGSATVLDKGFICIPEKNGEDSGWLDIQLKKPFAYNGRDNLVVEIDPREHCSKTLLIIHVTSKEQSRILARTPTMGRPDDQRAVVQFVFAEESGTHR